MPTTYGEVFAGKPDRLIAGSTDDYGYAWQETGLIAGVFGRVQGGVLKVDSSIVGHYYLISSQAERPTSMWMVARFPSTGAQTNRKFGPHVYRTLLPNPPTRISLHNQVTAQVGGGNGSLSTQHAIPPDLVLTDYAVNPNQSFPPMLLNDTWYRVDYAFSGNAVTIDISERDSAGAFVAWVLHGAVASDPNLAPDSTGSGVTGWYPTFELPRKTTGDNRIEVREVGFINASSAPPPPPPPPAVYTQPTYRDGVGSDGGNVSAITATAAVPAGLVTGDLLILIADSSSGSGNPTVTTPTGWTLKLRGTDSNLATDIFYKVADGTEADVVLTYSVAVRAVCQMASYGGVDPVSPFITDSILAEPGTTQTVHTANAIVNADPLALGIFHGASKGIGPATWTPPTGLTERLGTDHGNTSSSNIFSELAGSGPSLATGTYTWAGTASVGSSIATMWVALLRPPTEDNVFTGWGVRV